MVAITPTALRSWDSCPKKLWYRHLSGVPAAERGYYEYGKKCEKHFYALLMFVIRPKCGVRFNPWEKNDAAPTEADAEDDGSPEYRLASWMVKNAGFQEMLFKTKSTIELQPEVSVPCGMTGHPDLVFPVVGWIDVKTSSGPWDKERLMEHKWQGRGYCAGTGLPGAFLVGNKATNQVQFIRVEGKADGELEEKVAIIKEAFATGTFPAAASPANCRMCDWADHCDRLPVGPKPEPVELWIP